MTKKILIVEDDDNIRELLRLYLEREGYEITEAENGAVGLSKWKAENPDMMLLDVMMPDMDGFQVLQKIRAKNNVPVLMLTAKSGEEDKVAGLRLGADDFIPKPFDNLEVLARVEAQLRRVKKFSAPPEKKQRFVCGDLCLDREEFTVTAEGNPVTLTAREFEILALLMEYPKRVFTREQIYQHVWGEEYFGDDNTVNVHVSNLRSKLGRVSDREYIKTVWGIGFKLAEP